MGARRWPSRRTVRWAICGREQEVAEPARRGAITREIAESMHILERTVELHPTRAYQKSGRKDRRLRGSED